MSARYCGYQVDVGDGVIAGWGEDRECGFVVVADCERITIGWDSGTSTTIDLTRHVVDDDSVEVYSSIVLAREALASEEVQS